MEFEPDLDELLPPASPSPSPSPKLKRLRKKTTNVVPKDQPHLESPEGDESDGLDPLFSEGAKRVLEFTGPQFGDEAFWDDDGNGDGEGLKEGIGGVNWTNTRKRKNRKHSKSKNIDDDDYDCTGPEHEVDYLFNKEVEAMNFGNITGSVDDKIKKKRKNGADKPAKNPKASKRKQDEERKAYLAQQADFQRIMRERKSVGFKPKPMVEKPISSVLEKIRQRKMEVFNKMMDSRIVQKSAEENLSDNNVEEDCTHDVEDVLDTDKVDATVNEVSEETSCSSDEQTTNDMLAEETEKLFRAPVDDTQDLFSDSQTSDSQENPLQKEPADVSPSLPSLNLRLDSALPDDTSSDEEESDKENNEPLLKPSSKYKFSAIGDPMKAFLDEEALEDDSDNDLLPPEDKDEESDDDDDMEEHCDYIVTDFKEEPNDREMRDQLHQIFLQQQDEVRTEKLKQKFNCGSKQQDPTSLEVEDENENDDNKNRSKKSESSVQKQPSTRVTTKMLRGMIPLMFTDMDDGYVSSGDEVTETSLSREHLLHKKGLEKKSKLLTAAEQKKTKLWSAAGDDSSKEVFDRIKKLKSVPETKKNAKPPSFFDALLTKGSGVNSNKSSFLRRASTHPVPSSHRNGPSTGRSFIFGRDDSRSSASITEDSLVLNQTETQVKKVVSAKFTGSQTKWGTQETQTDGEQVIGTSLFEILKSSSVNTGRDTREDIVDHQAVFASFKSLKKQIKIDRRL